jgi:hypothetical protein
MSLEYEEPLSIFVEKMVRSDLQGWFHHVGSFVFGKISVVDAIPAIPSHRGWKEPF